MTEGCRSATPYFDGYKTIIASPMLTGVRKNYSYIYNIYKNLFLDARFKYYT